MRIAYRTAQFRRDFKRVNRGPHRGHIDDTLLAALELLAADAALPARYVDHPMKGAFSDCRDCHLRPDLVLVYRKRCTDALELVQLGSGIREQSPALAKSRTGLCAISRPGLGPGRSTMAPVTSRIGERRAAGPVGDESPLKVRADEAGRGARWGSGRKLRTIAHSADTGAQGEQLDNSRRTHHSARLAPC